MNLEVIYYVAAGSAVFTILVIVLAIIKTNKELKQNKKNYNNNIEQLTNDKEDCKVRIEKENKYCKEKCEQDKNEENRSILITDKEGVKCTGILIMILSGVVFFMCMFSESIIAGISVFISGLIIGIILYALGQIISLLIKLVNQNTIIYNEIENERKKEK